MRNIFKLKSNWKLAISIIGVMIAISIWLSIYLYDNDYSIANFNVNGGYIIDLRTDRNWEVSKPIYCRVIKNEKLVVPVYVIGRTIEEIEKLNFEIVENKKNAVFAIVEGSFPYVVLAAFDFENQKYWPCRTSTQGREEAYMQGKELIKQLNSGKVNIQYTLSTNIPGNINLKVSP